VLDSALGYVRNAQFATQFATRAVGGGSAIAPASRATWTSAGWSSARRAGAGFKSVGRNGHAYDPQNDLPQGFDAQTGSTYREGPWPFQMGRSARLRPPSSLTLIKRAGR